MKTHSYIEASISHYKPGHLVFLTDFRGKGTEAAIKKAMSRMAQAGKIERLAHGIYYVRKSDAKFGTVKPDPDEVIAQIARKENVRIKPSGAYAVHRLGLTTQVPTKRVYITDGNPRVIRLGQIVVRFKATSAKKLAMQGEVSSLVIQAIEEIGVDHISKDIELKLKNFLLKEDLKKLEHDLRLTTGRVNDFIVNLLSINSKLSS